MTHIHFETVNLSENKPYCYCQCILNKGGFRSINFCITNIDCTFLPLRTSLQGDLTLYWIYFFTMIKIHLFILKKHTDICSFNWSIETHSQLITTDFATFIRYLFSVNFSFFDNLIKMWTYCAQILFLYYYKINWFVNSKYCKIPIKIIKPTK